MKTTPKKTEEFVGYSHFGCKSGVPYEWIDKPSNEVQQYLDIKRIQISSDLYKKIAADYTP
ncbi:MAG: hypothetical protein ACFFCZ_09850 [Promethearchaeota archaeon]